MLEPIFEGSIPYLRSRFSNRFESPISLASVSDHVGLARYKSLARETNAGFYFSKSHTTLEEPCQQPLWKPDLAHQRF